MDIIFGFLCSLGQSIVLSFCWTVLILLMGVYVHVWTQPTLFIVVVYLCLYVGLLQFCGVFLFFSFFSFFFSFLYKLKILNLLYFFYIYSFVCLFYCSFPLAVNLWHIQIFFIHLCVPLRICSFLPFLSAYLLVCPRCSVPHWAPCCSLVCGPRFAGGDSVWFPLLSRPAPCTLYLLDCLDFACGRICVVHIPSF